MNSFKNKVLGDSWIRCFKVRHLNLVLRVSRLRSLENKDIKPPNCCSILYQFCRAPLIEECPQHHGHKGDPGMMPGTCGTIGEKAQVILV